METGIPPLLITSRNKKLPVLLLNLPLSINLPHTPPQPHEASFTQVLTSSPAPSDPIRMSSPTAPASGGGVPAASGLAVRGRTMDTDLLGGYIEFSRTFSLYLVLTWVFTSLLTSSLRQFFTNKGGSTPRSSGLPGSSASALRSRCISVHIPRNLILDC